MRSVLAVIGLCTLTCSVQARLGNQRDADLDRKLAVTSMVTASLAVYAVPVDPPGEVKLSKNTKVFLNGVATEMSRVPVEAEITRMELDSDGQTVLRIEFRVAK